MHVVDFSEAVWDSAWALFTASGSPETLDPHDRSVWGDLIYRSNQGNENPGIFRDALVQCCAPFCPPCSVLGNVQ